MLLSPTARYLIAHEVSKRTVVTDGKEEIACPLAEEGECGPLMRRYIGHQRRATMKCGLDDRHAEALVRR